MIDFTVYVQVLVVAGTEVASQLGEPLLGLLVAVAQVLPLPAHHDVAVRAWSFQAVDTPADLAQLWLTQLIITRLPFWLKVGVVWLRALIKPIKCLVKLCGITMWAFLPREQLLGRVLYLLQVLHVPLYALV